MVRTSYSSGFTVIEVMLFLAVSGLMILGMFVGISGSINRQRYDDAVFSFQDYMQGQFNLVDNVRNNRDLNYTCEPGLIAEDSTPDEARGTSEDCTIVGRLVTTTNGRDFISEPVFSTSGTIDTSGDDAVLLDSMQLTLGPSDATNDHDDYTLAWSTKVYTDSANPGTSNSAQLLIVRMPTSSIVRTYLRTNTTQPLDEFWGASSDDEIALCVAPDGLVQSNPIGVRLMKNATNANSVQRIAAGDGSC